MPSNAVKVLDAVRLGKAHASKKTVAEATGMSWGTMCKVVNDLLERGFLLARPGKTTTPGRPSVPLAVNAGAGFWCGLDIGSESTRILFSDMNFRILHEERHATEPFHSDRRFFEWTGELFRAAFAASALPPEKLLGTGISLSGIVDSEQGVIVSGGNWGLKQGSSLPVAELAREFGVPAYAVTTQVAAVCAEYNFGQRAGCGNLVTIGLGVGVGSGVIANHMLLISHPKRPIGYIGHTLIPGNHRLCSCGFRGCLESYSGGNNLKRVAAEQFPDHPKLHGAAALDRAAAEGDPGAAEIIDRAAEYNAAGAAAMIQLYSPEALIFSGGQSRAEGELFRNTIRKLYEILPEERRNCFIGITTLGEYQSALGAARLAFEKFF
ncbi:MAG: ROK family protein [Lentisphaeria bacterium]|nr:ROK family protein [Lentisphaeria bacterium]